MKIKFLQAYNGDAILINFKDMENQIRNILVDGGPPRTYHFKNKKKTEKQIDLKFILDNLRSKNQKIDLLILTHIDDDHIGGILKWFSVDKVAYELIGKVWFNSAKLIAESLKTKVSEEELLEIELVDGIHTGVTQAISFEDYVESHNLWDRQIIKVGLSIPFHGITFTILSPNEIKLESLKRHWLNVESELYTAGSDDYDLSVQEHIENDHFTEDTSIPNGSSIAFLMTYQDKKMLLLGDAHSKVVVQSLVDLGYSKEKPLQVDLVKLSHHGSQYNTSNELLDLIDCRKFVICSNGAKHNLPDKRCLARIINTRKNSILFFNYENKIEQIFSSEDFNDFKFKAVGIDEFTI